MKIAAWKWTTLATATALFAVLLSAYPAADAQAGCHRLLCRMFISCENCDFNCTVSSCEWGECVPWAGGEERCKCFICAE